MTFDRFLFACVVFGLALRSVGAFEVGAYFPQVASGREFEVAELAARDSTRRLTFLNYAFGNLYPRRGGYECGMADVDEAQRPGEGGYAARDFLREPTRRLTTRREAARWRLAGHFAELKALKRRQPGLKVFISLGGWNWSKWFSPAAASEAGRRQLVRSCLALYLAGDLPRHGDLGGPGAARGVFDGIDIDWEFPGGGGQPYNLASAEDRRNFSLLLAEFRRQLDRLGRAHGRRYLLTVAVPVAAARVAQTEPAVYARYVDWINLMTYDFAGAWDGQGPTNFHAALARDTEAGAPPGDSIVEGVERFLAQGVAADKLVLGMPFYARGWAGVAPGPRGDGLFQPAQGAAPGGVEPGAATWRELQTQPALERSNAVARQTWRYADGVFWGYDSPADLRAKAQWARTRGLGGVMAWALDGDDDAGTLVEAMGARD